MEPTGVRLQGLAGSQQVLALARLAASRSETGTFTVKGIDDVFHETRLPRPGRIDNMLSSLARRGLVSRAKERGQWNVTPRGRQTSESAVSGLDLAALI